MSGTGLTLPFVDASQENLDTLLQGLGVLLSAATIALALFLQWGLVRLRRPKLSLSVSANVDEEDWVPLDFADRAELYLRIRVHNERKKVTAHNVEVLLLKVQRPHHAKVAPVVPSRQLAWADTPDERLAIPSGTWRRVDVSETDQEPESRGCSNIGSCSKGVRTARSDPPTPVQRTALVSRFCEPRTERRNYAAVRHRTRCAAGRRNVRLRARNNRGRGRGSTMGTILRIQGSARIKGDRLVAPDQSGETRTDSRGLT